MDQLEQGLLQVLGASFGTLNLTVIDLIRQAAADAGEQDAILEPGRASLSYAGLLKLAEQTVSALNALGFRSGSRIAGVMTTSPEGAAVDLCVAAGMALLIMSPNAPAEEYERYFSHTRVDALLIEVANTSVAREVAGALGIPIIEVAPSVSGLAGTFRIVGAPASVAAPQFAGPDDTVVVVPTSGTTGQPKFVQRTQRELLIAVYAATLPFLQLSGPVVNMLPLHHSAGALMVISSVVAKKGFVCLRGFTAGDLYRYLALYQPEGLLHVVPAILQALVAAAPAQQDEIDRLKLKIIYTGSATLSESLLHSWQQIKGTAVAIGYGLSETGPITSLTLTSGDNAAYKAGSVGTALPFCRIRICDENGDPVAADEVGEITIISPLMVRGYENNPAANAEQFRNGWFRTGDKGYLDAAGLLYLTGRVKELINRGGSKISPLDIDQIIMQHPAVVEAATFGFPHAALGEDIAVAVVLRDPTVSESDLRRFAAERLPLAQTPSRFIVVDELPKTAVGKIRRNLLAEHFGQALRR